MGAGLPATRCRRSGSSRRQYGVSLITVRRALDELAREQRIERARGRGTFVLPSRIDRDLDEPLSFSEEMQRRGLDPETRLIASRPETASERVAAALELEPGSPTLFVERLRLADGDPLLLEQAHLPAERFPGLLDSDLEAGSLYQLLSERYGTTVARTRETFEPVMLRSREAALLGLKPRMPALLVEGIAFSDEGVPVEFSRTFVRGDRHPLLRRTNRPCQPVMSAGRGRKGGQPRPSTAVRLRQAPTRRSAMSRSWLRLPVLAVILVMLAACAGNASTPHRPRRRANGSRQPCRNVGSASARRRAQPRRQSRHAAPQRSRSVGATPSEEASTREPSDTPPPTPVIVAPQSVAPGVKFVRWYCCLGAGDAPEQVAVEKKVINDFNASHTDIQIAGEFVLYAQAYDTLATEIAGGNPPDIIGPVGFGGANAFSGHWLDLAAADRLDRFDTSQCESSAVDYFKVGDAPGGPALRDLSVRAVLPGGRVPGDRHQ